MGRIICNEHGEQSNFECCEHCYIDFNNGVKSKTNHIEVLNLKLCDDCYKNYSFQNIEKIKIEELIMVPDLLEKEIFEKYNLIVRKCICVECYSNLNNL